MKRTIKKQVWLNRDEAEQLRKKSKKACLTEAGLLRFLLRGYEPKAKPDDKFYDAMNEMREMTESIERLTRRLDDRDEIMTNALRDEIERWHRFQAAIEMTFLSPAESSLKWR